MNEPCRVPGSSSCSAERGGYSKNTGGVRSSLHVDFAFRISGAFWLLFGTLVFCPIYLPPVCAPARVDTTRDVSRVSSLDACARCGAWRGPAGGGGKLIYGRGRGGLH